MLAARHADWICDEVPAEGLDDAAEPGPVLAHPHRQRLELLGLGDPLPDALGPE